MESSACHHPPYPAPPFYSTDNRTENIIGGVIGMLLSHVKIYTRLSFPQNSAQLG